MPEASRPWGLGCCSLALAGHKALEGLSQASVEYQALQLISALEHYGVEWHWVRDANAQRLAIGVGPEGITICKEDFSLVNRVSYPVIQIATQSGKSVYLTVTKDTNDSVVLLFKLIMMMQYSRDFKGHLASLFLNEHINVGKKYVFDIRRTSKEVYDHARRALYNAGVVDLVSRTQSGERSSPSHSPSRDSQQDMGLDCSSCQQSRALQERLQKLKEALLCMLCCEEEIDAAFCPCGHMVCCQNCANQLQHVYLPTCTSLLSLTLNDNHQHRSSIPTPIHRDTDSPHSCSTTEYEHKLYPA
ncbi:hypothetical protein XENOCAPTIV_004914 [Xenoophorus captivus]|uniref:FERM domain-containing protein n=1 Tax=Xenoophorus captivus TaxID=1517983 RepID=A0ABV0Q835_9TELE